MQKLLLAIFLLTAYAQNSVEMIIPQENSLLEISEFFQPDEQWSLAIESTLPNYYWSNENDFSFKNNDTKKFIEFANSFCTQKLGEDFFKKNIKFYPSTSKISVNGAVYYLDYIFIYPEKGIDYNTTTHPTIISMRVEKKDESFEIIKGECNINEEVLKGNFISADDALQVAKKEIEKDINLPKKIIMLDFNLFKNSWTVRYEIPQKKTPQCTDFKMGAYVDLEIDAISKKIKKNVYCTFMGT